MSLKHETIHPGNTFLIISTYKLAVCVIVPPLFKQTHLRINLLSVNFEIDNRVQHMKQMRRIYCQDVTDQLHATGKCKSIGNVDGTFLNVAEMYIHK